MGSLASAGIGSGIDIGALVTSLVDAERTPATSRYDSQEATLQAQVSGYGTLKSALSSFQGSLSTLKFSSSFNAMTATTSDDTLVTGTASSIAKEGSFALTVATLAQQHSVSTLAAYSDVTDTIGSGTLSFDFGYDNTGSFESNADKTTQTVTISADNNSLSGIRDAVNAAEIGVTASIVDTTGDGNYKLLFTSDDTGKNNGLKISVDDDDGTDTGTDGLSILAFDPTAAEVGVTENMAATDAEFTINGLSMTNASNSIGSAVSGMTFNLKATTASAINITVASDTSKVNESVTEFTTKFNELADTLDLLGDYDFSSQEGGALLGDSVLRGIESKIRRMLSSSITDASGNSASLSSVGIKTGRDGKLTVDTATLNTAIAADSTLLARLFSAQATTSDSQVSYVSSTEDTQTGDYGIELSAVASRGSLTGAASTSLDFLAAVPSLTVSVDGVSSAAISLTQQVYASGAALATEIQTQINADNALKGNGSSVLVSYNTADSTLSLLSALYGSTSTIDITALSNFSASGLSIATGTAGLDVAGTIGGNAATGSGTFLTGTSGDSSGLKVNVSGGSAGNRGLVSFNRGIADQLDTMLTDFLATDSLIDSRTSGLTANIARINEQREELNVKMVDYENRLFKQFNAMDSIVAQLKATGEYLTNQLENLPGVVKKDN